MENTTTTQPNDNERTKPSVAVEAYHNEPSFDQDEGLSEEDHVLADSFPASDPPAMR
jgi:hypothetical protein